MAKYKKDLFEALNFETAPTYRLVCPAEIIEVMQVVQP